MNVDEFLQAMAGADLDFPKGSQRFEGRSPEAMDALFHLPLLALAVLVIARAAEFPTRALGRSVAMLLIEHFSALRRAPHSIEASLTLRRRCADALAFLEAVGLVSVANSRNRIVALTEAGRRQINKARRDSSDLGFFVRRLVLSQERVMARVGGNGN